MNVIGTVTMLAGFPLVWETSRRARELDAGRRLAVAALVVLALEVLIGVGFVVVRLVGI